MLRLPKLRAGNELEPLIALLPSRAVVVELGVFSGEGTEQFIRNPKIAQILCVDQWTGGYDPDDMASNADMVTAERAFILRTCGDPRVFPLKLSTVDAAEQFLWPAADLVYLDADHRYDAVVADLRAWLPKIKPGGFIGGHDYGWPTHPDVQRAVDDVLGPPDIVFPDTSWLKRVPYDVLGI